MVLKIGDNGIHFDGIKEKPEEDSILLYCIKSDIDCIPPYKIEVNAEMLSDFGREVIGIEK